MCQFYQIAPVDNLLWAGAATDTLCANRPEVPMPEIALPRNTARRAAARAASAVLIAVVMVGLAACSTPDPEKTSPPPIDVTATETTTPTPKPTEGVDISVDSSSDADSNSSSNSSVVIEVPPAPTATADPSTTGPTAGYADAVEARCELLASRKAAETLELITQLRQPAYDLQAAGATLTADQLILANACEAQRAAAVEKLAAPKPDPTGPERWSKQLDDSLSAWLKPFSQHSLAAIALFAAALVLARLLALVPRLPLRSSKWFGIAALILGTVLAALNSISIVAGVQRLDEPGDVFVADWDLFWASLWIPVVWWFVGAALISVFLARQLKLSIEVKALDGAASAPLTAELISTLNQIGGSTPRGLETPRGTDVTLLEKALSSFSANKVLSALQAAITALFATAPWKVTVETLSGERLSVSMSRNGRSVSNTSVDPTTISDVTEQAHSNAMTLAAATVVAVLAKKHHGFNGLAGATNATSIAMQVIATTRLKSEPDKASDLLAKALDADPDNLLAEIALRHHQYRRSTDETELGIFKGQLTTWSAKLSESALPKRMAGLLPKRLARLFPKPGVRELRLRVLRNQLAVWRNLTAKLATPAALDKADFDLAEVAAKQLRTPWPSPLVQRLRPAIATDIQVLAAYAAAREKDAAEADRSEWSKVAKQLGKITKRNDFQKWVEQADVSAAPNVAYAAACRDVRIAALATPPSAELTPTLKQRLDDAFIFAELKEWAREDPELSTLRALGEFADLVAPDGVDFWTLTPLAPFKKKLVAIGVTRPALLLPLASDVRLHRYLDTSRLKLEYAIRAATLVKKAEAVQNSEIPAPADSGDTPVEVVQKNAVSGVVVDLVGALLDDGIAKTADIGSEWTSADGTKATALARVLGKKRVNAPSAEQIAEWIAKLKAQRG